MIRCRHLSSGALVLALSLAAPVRAADTEPGVWWEHTIDMRMQGMTLPPQTQKICVPKAGMQEPPGANKDQRCEITDMKHVGPKMSWKMKCSEPEGMTGEGEITQGKDSYTGSMAMHTAQGDMNMKMKGKLLGGDCDAAANRKKAAAIQKQQKEQQEQGEAAMAQGCDNAIEEVQLRLFSGPLGLCKKPEQVAKVCARIGTRPGYIALQNQRDPEQAKIAKSLCKKDPEKVRARLCTDAAAEAKGDSTPQDTLDFLAGNCPDETRALAKKVCAGRSFTGMAPNLRSICVQYAREELSGSKAKSEQSEESEDQGEPAEEQQSTKDRAKKAIFKGLFGK